MMKPNNEPLDPRVTAELKALKEIPERDPQAAAHGRMKFLQEAASMAPTVNTVRAKTEQAKKASLLASVFAHRPAALAARLILIAALALGLLGAGGAAAVYASRDSLPGDTLYPIKTWGEELLLALASTPQTELNLNLQYADRRMDEISAVLDEDPALAAQVMLRLQGHLQGALLAAAEVNGEQAAKAMERVRQTLEHQQGIMQQLQGAAEAAGNVETNQTRQKIQEQLQIVEDQLLEEGLKLQGGVDGKQQLQQGSEGSGQGTQEGQQSGEPDQQGQGQGEAGQQQKGPEGEVQQTPLPDSPTFTPTPTPTLFPQGGPMQPGNGNQQTGGEVTPVPNQPQPGTKK